MRALLILSALGSAKVTDLRGRLDALKGDHIKMACPLGSLELNATEARLLARDATDVLTTTITHARDGVGRLLGALDRKVADPRWVAGPLHVDSECRAKLEAALVAAASPALVKAMILNEFRPETEAVVLLSDRETMQKAFDENGITEVKYVEPEY